MSDFKAQLLDIRRTLDAALVAARSYTDPDLTPAGLQSRREQLAATARQAAEPRLGALRADATREAATLAERAARLLPQLGTDADSTARTAAKWAQVSMILAAGKPLRDVLATADVATALAIREYGPSWQEAQSYQASNLGESMTGSAVPDHGPLHRSIDARLAKLIGGEDATNVLAAAHEAAAVAAGVEVAGKHMADVIAGTATGMSGMDASLAAHYAEQGARQSLAADTGDTAPPAQVAAS